LIFLALIIFAAAGLSVIFLDVASYTATQSQTLKSSGSSMGKALVVYDPGLTGFAKNVATKMAGDLQEEGYTVTLAGIRSSAAKDADGYNVVVVGGPIYGGNAAASVKSYLANLTPASGAIIGVFGVGSFSYPNQNVAPLPSGSTLIIKETLKIDTNENVDARSIYFVTQLLM
jgi:flavodoxin